MPFVVMGHGAAATFFEGQAGLARIQSLNAGFFIDAQHQGMFRRVEIESDYIPKLFSKMRVPGEFESTHQMGFDLMSRPDAGYNSIAQPKSFHQDSCALICNI